MGIIGICFLGVIAFGSYLLFFKESEQKIIDQKNGYILLSNASEYEKELFAMLEEVEDDDKASLIFQLFLANFYSLELANSKNDVRGVQFVYQSFQDDFVRLAKDHVYYMVPNSFFGERKVKLAIVEEVVVVEIVESSFEIGEQTFDSLIIRGEVVYEENPGYREEVELELIFNEDKYEVVTMTAILSNF